MGLKRPHRSVQSGQLCEGCGRERFGQLNRFNKGILQLYGAAVNINSVEFRRFTVLNMRTRTAEQDDKKPPNFWEAPKRITARRCKNDQGEGLHIQAVP